MSNNDLECRLVEAVLEHEGLKLNPEYCTVEAIVDFACYWPDYYTIYDWIADTQMNDPKCFM